MDYLALYIKPHLSIDIPNTQQHFLVLIKRTFSCFYFCFMFYWKQLKHWIFTTAIGFSVNCFSNPALRKFFHPFGLNQSPQNLHEYLNSAKFTTPSDKNARTHHVCVISSGSLCIREILFTFPILNMRTVSHMFNNIKILNIFLSLYQG